MTASERLRNQAIDRFWETVPPLWGMIRTHLRAAATGDFDISVQQFHILRHVRRGKGSVSELAEAQNISRPAISQGVETLVKKGLLTRVQSAQDRRYVELTLTQAGSRLLDTVFQGTREWMKKRMDTLTAEELKSISDAMQSLKKMLEESPVEK
jgi:DNA-binding MarR family transcriptional regulator